MMDLSHASDTTAADWVVAGLRASPERVPLVPLVFPSYVYIFHPAARGSQRVRWSEIAEANDRRAHAGMSLEELTGTEEGRVERQPGVFDDPPQEGRLPADLTDALARVLAEHTSTPDVCWFSVWEGWGGLGDDIKSAPRFGEQFGRRYHLLVGPVLAAAEDFNPPWEQSPSMWWPDDRAWIVATEIDFNMTEVGCTTSCADEILALPELEAFRVEPADRLYNDDADIGD